VGEGGNVLQGEGERRKGDCCQMRTGEKVKYCFSLPIC